MNSIASRSAANIAPLTSLRFFAALAIVVLHMEVLKMLPMPADARLGLGVSFFFVLSGFILSHVYGRMEKITTASYLRNRLARIWPLHAVTFVIAAALLWSSALANPKWQQVALINLSLLHAWIPLTGSPFSFNGVSWSISAELGFYLLFPLLARARRWWLAVPLVGLAYVLVFYWLTQIGPQEPAPAWNFSAKHLLQQHPLMRCLEFAVGVTVQRSLHRENVAAWINRIPLVWELVALASVGVFVYYSQSLLCGDSAPGCNPYVGIWLSQSAGMLFFAGFILVLAVSRGWLARALSHRVLVLLGEISFATYMIHQIIIKVFDKYGLGQSLDWPAKAMLIVATVYVSSYLLWRGVEVPSRRWLGASPKSRGGAQAAEQNLSADGMPSTGAPASIAIS